MNELSLLVLGTITCILHILFDLHFNLRYVYSVDVGRVVESMCAHDDAVSCLVMRKDILVSGSWDTTTKVGAFLSRILNF